MATERDEYAGETGLKDDYDGTIVDAWFERDSQRFGGNAVLALKIEADDGDEVEQFYGCGAEWDTYDGGQSVAHPNDDPAKDKMKKFHVNTKIQRLVNTAVGLDGVRDVWDKIKAEQGNPPGSGARFANIWKGLRFHWEVDAEEMTVPDRDNAGEKKKITVTTSLPTAFLGVADEGGSGSGGGAAGQSTGAVNSNITAPSAGSTSTPQAASASGSGPLAVLDSVDAVVAKQVVALAKANDYGGFVDRVMELPGVLSNNALMTAIADEAWYNTVKEG